MSTLTTILDHIGFAERPQQTKLHAHLLDADETGVVVQAGTGTGKSLAVLAAAYDMRKQTGMPTLVVTPTNVLMDQYLTVDAPRVSDALGITIRALKGRNRYLCESAPGFAGPTRLPDEVIAEEVEMNAALFGADIVEPRNTYWFGCPGSDECDRDAVCHYRRAKAQIADADIIVTNAHLLIIDNQLKGKDPIEIADKDNPDAPPRLFQPSIFPDLGAVFVDEAHTLEENLRSFATRSIPLSSIPDDCTTARYLLWELNRAHRSSTTIKPDGKVVAALRELADWRPAPKETAKKNQREAVSAAAYILDRGKADAYATNDAVLWFEPAQHPRSPKLISTQINLAGGARRLLTAQPFGLVSGTIPKSLPSALGVPEARFIDVGHPFDYGQQAKLGISQLSGSFKAAQNEQLVDKRAAELKDKVLAAGGGALLLFSSYRNLELVYYKVAPALRAAGLLCLRQERESDKADLGAQFRSDGNAVLFGTESFATGFDVPGDALRFVGIWNLPYPGLDPVTKAISARSRARYNDMMLMKVAQAAGRLIRTATDTGVVWIADSRAEGVLFDDDDPMIAHFADFKPLVKRRVLD